MPGPAATVGSMHTCPMCSGYVSHVGGPIIGPGVPTVLIGGKPAAVMGDMCTCAGGPPDTIIQGESTVLIGGKPAATVGCMTAHGGTITEGEPTVLIGTGVSAPTAIAPIERIPFPEISKLLKTVASLTGRRTQLNEAIANQEALRQEAENSEGEPTILRVEWLSEDLIIKDSQLVKTVKVKAFTINADNGVRVNFKVTRLYKENIADEEDLVENVVELSGTVQDGEAIAEFEIEDYEQIES